MMRRMWMGMAALATLVATSVLVAQETPLRFQGLVFSYSDRADVERFLGEQLTCGRYRELEAAEHIREARACLPTTEASRAKPQAIFINGRLKTLRYLLAPDAQLEEVRNRLAERFGEPELREGQEETVRGLRYWVFPTDPYHVLLSEARNRQSGVVRLRINLVDPRGDWM